MRRQELRQLGASPVQLATKLLHCTHSTTLPIDILDIAAKLSINVLSADMGDVLCYLDSTGSNPTILINSKDNSKRQRFMIAKYIGVYLLSPNGKYIEQPTNNLHTATSFALHLLMPLWLLEPIIEYDSASEEDIAAKFDVSVSMLRSQLSNLM